MSVFLDTNVPFYAAGSTHPLKGPCSQILRLAGELAGQFITDAEVLREILHRYLAIRRWTEGREMFREFATVMRDHIVPVSAEDVEVAALLADLHASLAARDLIHLAVMRRLGVSRIVSTDRGFDGLPDIERLDPARFEEWRDALISSAF